MGNFQRYAGAALAWQREKATLLLNALMPPRCPLSDQVVTRQGTLAAHAWSRLHHLSPPWCPACGWPFEKEQPAALLCVSCTASTLEAGRLTGANGLDRIRAALSYSDELAPAVLQLKYADRVDGALVFGRLMAAAGAELFCNRDAILVPVPLHTGRLRKRRYNQAGVLAAVIGSVTGLQMAPLALVRTKPTPTQKGGSRTARRRNVAGAFAVRSPDAIKNRSIILIDDVLTTGATLMACARPLRAAGATNVSAVALARVIKSSQDALYDPDAIRDV